MKKRLISYQPLLLALVVLGGCQGEDDSSEEPQSSVDASIEERVELLCADTSESESNCASFSEKLLLSVENHNYLTADYVKAHNNNGYPSVVSIGKNIAVYVDNEGAEDFLQVDPDSRGSFAEVPIGTTIIREVWGDTAMEKYTAMIKMEAGYFPEGGDFSYIELGVNGAVISGGKNAECGSCHLQRSSDGFLFGVDSDYRVDLNNPNPGGSQNNTIEGTTERLKLLARQAMENEYYKNSSDFKIVNEEPFPSALNGANYIQLYISEFAYDEYLKADPDSDLPVSIDIPEDTVMVRTVSNAGGELTGLTVMVKGPEGYYPDGGDYYYGQFDTDVQVVESNGVPTEGPLVVCGSCHDAQRKDQAFLFGVSPAFYFPDDSGSNFEAAENKMKLLARTSMINAAYENSDDFIKVNDEPFQSALNSDNYIQLFVSSFGYEEYLKADPDSSIPVDIDLPEDTVLVRTVSNAAGELTGLTVMVKGPEGYYPDGGDFYYGQFDTNVQVIENNGVANEGALTACGSCHDATRKDMAYLFGVSPSYHTPRAQ